MKTRSLIALAVNAMLFSAVLNAFAQEGGDAAKGPASKTPGEKTPEGSGSPTDQATPEPYRAIEAPQPKFEKREKFEDDPPATSAALPQPSAGLDHALIGPRGTFYLHGAQGEANFLWPVGGKSPKFYRESMLYTSSEADAVVYRLSGRFHRVSFKVATKPESSGHRIWVRNGDKDWTPFDTAIAAPRAF